MDAVQRNIIIAAGAVVAFVVAFSLAPEEWQQGFWGFVWLTVLAVAYLIPTVIAAKRKHHNLGAIIAVNVLLGWTMLGWIIALVWSLTAVRNPYAQQAPPAYRVGDVVNGHRFNGQTWEPIA